MKARQVFGVAAATVTIAAGVVVGMPGIALAHTPSVHDECDGLHVSLQSYEGTSTNNTVTITIDGASHSYNFGGSFTRTDTWSQTVSHTWTVVIDANRNTGNATQYDASFNGVQAPCQQPQPQPTTVAWTPIDGTCASPTGKLAVTYTPGQATYQGSAAA